VGMLPNITSDDVNVLREYVQTLEIFRRTTARPVCIATVGPVGSGKTSVCRAVCDQLPATLVSCDSIKLLIGQTRGMFRKDSHRDIALHALSHIINCGGNAALDNDNVEPEKRRQISNIMKMLHGVPIFVHITTNLDTIIGRIIDEKYTGGSIFGNTECSYEGDYQTRAATTRLQALLHRLPQHYAWSPHSSSWEPRAIDRSLVHTINTASEHADKSIERFATYIRSQY